MFFVIGPYYKGIDIKKNKKTLLPNVVKSQNAASDAVVRNAWHTYKRNKNIQVL